VALLYLLSWVLFGLALFPDIGVRGPTAAIAVGVGATVGAGLVIARWSALALGAAPVALLIVPTRCETSFSPPDFYSTGCTSRPSLAVIAALVLGTTASLGAGIALSKSGARLLAARVARRPSPGV
jgi:hypothetical protein